MLYRENGDPIVYGCMRALELDFSYGGMEPNIDDYTCHFPCLEKLVISGCDPVLTNALFNGADKLEHLQLYTEYEDVDGICDRQMFKLCRLQNLRHLKLKYTANRYRGTPRDEPSTIAQYSKFVEHLINRPRCLQSFPLTRFWREQKLLDIMTSMAAFANI
ncbi:hypothetical protein LPJ75_000399 [Coemansia sp. RSA 2598]|nr:hypothetical protein LPJ75_000399 [Coemansia sp. RSA 2598]